MCDWLVATFFCFEDVYIIYICNYLFIYYLGFGRMRGLAFN